MTRRRSRRRRSRADGRGGRRGRRRSARRRRRRRRRERRPFGGDGIDVRLASAAARRDENVTVANVVPESGTEIDIVFDARLGGATADRGPSGRRRAFDRTRRRVSGFVRIRERRPSRRLPVHRHRLPFHRGRLARSSGERRATERRQPNAPRGTRTFRRRSGTSDGASDARARSRDGVVDFLQALVHGDEPSGDGFEQLELPR